MRSHLLLLAFLSACFSHNMAFAQNQPGSWSFEEIDISRLQGKNFNSYTMTTFRNRVGQLALYIGVNDDDGCELWRSTDGKNFTVLADRGLSQFGGDKNQRYITSFATYKGELYAGTWGFAGQRPKIFRSSDGKKFQLIVRDGLAKFGAPKPNGNLAMTYMTVHKAYLYLGVYNPQYGPQLWRYDGNDWRLLLKNGRFSATTYGNTDISTLAVYQGELYLSTENRSAGTQVWRLKNETTIEFEQVNQNAFGEWFNNNAALFVSDGALLVNTWDFKTGSKIYRYKGGKKWVREAAPGFGNPKTILTSMYHYLESSPNLAMVSAYNPGGFDLWARFPGGRWERVTQASTLNLPNAYVYAGSAIQWKQDLYFVAGNIGGFNTEVPMKLFRGRAHPSVAVSYTSKREVRLTFAHPKGWNQGLDFDTINLAIFFPGYGWVGNLFDQLMHLFKVIEPLSPTKIVIGLPNIPIPSSWRFKVSVRSYNGEFAEAQK